MKIPNPVQRVKSVLPQQPSDGNSKTGYSLRFDLLALAKDILSERIHIAREDKDKNCPWTFSTEDVITEAEKLKKFLVTKD